MSVLSRFRAWMGRACASGVARLERREEGTALACMRMLVGLALVLEMGRYCLTTSGYDVLLFAFADVAHGGYRTIEPTLLASWLGGANPAVISLLACSNLACGVCLLLGIFGRVPALLAWLVSASLIGPTSPVSGGSDLLLTASLFTLALSDCTRTLSLDCRLRTGRARTDELVPAWPRILGLVQLAAMYGATGLQKLVSSAWLPTDGYSALYQIMQSPHFARFPSVIVDSHGAFVWPAATLTALTVPWEITFPVVLFVRRLRIPYALFGVMMHLGIWLTMEVGSFSLLTLAFYPTLLSGGQRPAGLARLARQFGGQS